MSAMLYLVKGSKEQLLVEANKPHFVEGAVKVWSYVASGFDVKDKQGNVTRHVDEFPAVLIAYPATDGSGKTWYWRESRTKFDAMMSWLPQAFRGMGEIKRLEAEAKAEELASSVAMIREFKLKNPGVDSLVLQALLISKGVNKADVAAICEIANREPVAAPQS